MKKTIGIFLHKQEQALAKRRDTQHFGYTILADRRSDSPLSRVEGVRDTLEPWSLISITPDGSQDTTFTESASSLCEEEEGEGIGQSNVISTNG